MSEITSVASESLEIKEIGDFEALTKDKVMSLANESQEAVQDGNFERAIEIINFLCEAKHQADTQEG